MNDPVDYHVEIMTCPWCGGKGYIYIEKNCSTSYPCPDCSELDDDDDDDEDEE